MAKLDKTNALRILDRDKIPYETLSYPPADEHLDGVSVAALLGESAQRVFKTLVLLGDDRQHYVCVIPAANELDLKAAAALFGVKSLRMVQVSELKDLTGYVRGGCSPIGMKKAFATVLDASELAQPYILVSGGRIGLQVKIKPADLCAACQARYGQICR